MCIRDRPRTPRPSSILPQREVERMEAAGLWLGNDAPLRMAEKEWTVYGAFSKPKGRLYLSYSALDGRGPPRGRSPVVSDLLRLFPELRVYPAQAYGNARGLSLIHIYRSRVPPVAEKGRRRFLALRGEWERKRTTSPQNKWAASTPKPSA